MGKIRSPQDFAAGMLFALFGVLGLYLSRNYQMGTAARMGPGYLPMVLSGLLVLFGLIIGLRALVLSGPGIETIRLRPVLVILAAVGVFGLLIERAGLAVTVAAASLVMGLASRRHWGEVILASLGMAVFCVLIFVYALDQPIDVWPW